MKTIVLGIITLLMFRTSSLLAENKLERIKVKGGNCDKCKTHIENAALAVEGVFMVHWNAQKNEMQVIFDDSKTTTEIIEKAIAKAGHDTSHFKATDDDYDKLPACCKYVRE